MGEPRHSQMWSRYGNMKLQSWNWIFILNFKFENPLITALARPAFQSTPSRAILRSISCSLKMKCNERQAGWEISTLLANWIVAGYNKALWCWLIIRCSFHGNPRFSEDSPMTFLSWQIRLNKASWKWEKNVVANQAWAELESFQILVWRSTKKSRW